MADLVGIAFSDEERRSVDLSYIRLHSALEKRGQSLLIIDNVDSEELLAPSRTCFLPKSDKVHILATTRIGAEKLRETACLSLDPLPEDDGVALIEKYRPFASDVEREAAREIVGRLGGFTLAVEVVAVYLRENPEVSCVAYLRRLRDEGIDAIDGIADGIQLSRHHESVITKLLEPTLAQRSPEEMLTLEYASLLPPDSIPIPWLKEMVSREFPDLSQEPKPGYPDPWAVLIRRLSGLRLLVVGDDPRLARMHRLIQDLVVKRQGLSSQERKAGLIEHGMLRLRSHLSHFVESGWIDRENGWEIAPLQSFAEMFLDAGDPYGAQIAKSIALLKQALAAESLLRNLYPILSKRLGTDHPDTQEVLEWLRGVGAEP